jgi:protease IV
MTLDADMLADRRRLKRRASLWRMLAIGVVTAAIVVIGLETAGDGKGWLGGDHIARYVIDGTITDDRKEQKLLDEIAASARAKALIIHINSPGGTTTGAEALFAALRRIGEKKPVVAVLGTVAASGGYAAALAADHIVARGNTITGSIGVIMQWAEVGELLDKVGVRFEEVKSGPLKAEPSPFGKASPEVRAAMESMVRDSYEWFIDLVADRRPISAERARELADGRIYSGRQARDNNLVDAIGGEEIALAWLRSERKLGTGLKVMDWEKSSLSEFSLTGMTLGWLARATGLEGVASMLRLSQKTLRAERLNLDGLVSLWHPEG